MSKEFFDAVKAIEAEKGIPAEYLYGCGSYRTPRS